MCSMSFTVALRARSWLYTTRCSISVAFKPAYCQMTLMTGMLIAGKMSVGVRRITNGVSSSNTNAATTNV